MDERDADALFAALADADRRLVCRYIADRDDRSLTLEELAADAELGGPAESADLAAASEFHGPAKARLHHVHLPKLDDAGIVEYDPGTRVIDPNAALPTAMELVRTVEEDVGR